MVSNKSITVTLVSIPEVSPIPEYISPDSSEPASSWEYEYQSTEPLPGYSEAVLSTNEAAVSCQPPALTSVLVPLPPAGLNNFWVHYKVAPPYSSNAYYYFKMFVDGESVLNWGVGEREGFRGSVTLMPVQDAEARTFHFASIDDLDMLPLYARNSYSEPLLPASCTSPEITKIPAASLTIKVYRANGRRYAMTPDPTSIADLHRGCGHSV